ncbi:MAG: OprO/OprP family phosphate-selective porin [Bacteroidaceae bacterium]|nr:OprO/OprP family phosphate-selective porin [Bacteroidaceae bacterium]
MKKILTVACMAMALAAHAQENTNKWYDNLKFSGYGMLQYQATDKYSNQTITNSNGDPETVAVKDHANAFNLRLARFILDGKISDFDWRVQIQGTNAKGAGEPTVQLIDLYAEWVAHKEFRIKAGQFKRAFTFENPMNPITQGWYSYANVINALSGFGDRTGEKSSGGRDIGLQVQGDLFPNTSGRRLLHYQVGVYNGEGINAKETNNRKDIIGGLWVMPFEGFRIGAFGWTGSRGNMTDMNDDKVSIDKNRYALSAEYTKDEYTFRAEYLHSQGWGADKVGSNTIDYSKGDKADGWYVLGIVPVVKNKLHAKARYQTYREKKEWNSAKTMYEVGVNYYFTKNLQLNVEYALVNERAIVDNKQNYNFFDAQLDFRF